MTRPNFAGPWRLIDGQWQRFYRVSYRIPLNNYTAGSAHPTRSGTVTIGFMSHIAAFPLLLGPRVDGETTT